MKNQTQRDFFHRAAFTLIELLVVIAVISILAALILPLAKAVRTTRTKKLAYAELNEMTTAIVAYKNDHGFYPPDNPTNTLINPLYFELEGTVLTNIGGTMYFVTLDGSARISTNDVKKTFGVSGFVNSSTSPEGTDEKPAPKSYLKELKPTQVATNSPTGSKILVFSAGWGGPGDVLSGGRDPWQYNSSHPTNNPGSFDLWTWVYLNGKTNLVSNWSDRPQVIP